MLIEETPSVGLLIQSKALSSIDSKGQLGGAGARVVAAELLLRNVTVRNAALRPVTAGGRLYTWGSSDFGALGLGSKARRKRVP